MNSPHEIDNKFITKNLNLLKGKSSLIYYQSKLIYLIY